MPLGNVKLFEIGYCTHPEVMVLRGGRFKSVKFPAMAALIRQPDKNLLFDTGYGQAFFNATAHFPEKLYALTTPVTLEKPLHECLDEKVDAIFISHFHADHIGGLRDFPNVPIFCSQKAYAMAIDKRKSRFTKTRLGILPALLPEDFAQRAIFIETLPIVDLPNALFPFKKGHLLWDRYYVIELKGHAVGHYGLVVDDLFFISDAVWDMRSISENRPPNPLTQLIMDNAKHYADTLDKLQTLHKQNPTLTMIPTHCARTLQAYFDAPRHV